MGLLRRCRTTCCAATLQGQVCSSLHIPKTVVPLAVIGR
ncbi:hypothetical protein M3J09_008800 [Ascochyta lentis]